MGDQPQPRAFRVVGVGLISGAGLVAMIACETDPGPVNLGNPHELTVAELAEIVIALTHARSTIEHRELPVDDPTRRCPDISKAKRVLGWEPHVSLSDGLRATIGYHRARRSRASASSSRSSAA